jgi:hypothetical protein
MTKRGRERGEDVGDRTILFRIPQTSRLRKEGCPSLRVSYKDEHALEYVGHFLERCGM